MKRLAIAMMAGVVMLWATMAFAQDYAALDDSQTFGPYVGVGGLFIIGDDAANPPNSTTEFLPTVNLTGLTDSLAYQVFYGFGQDSTVWGGNLDYIFADNFDKCFTCPDQGVWWFGVGPTYMSFSDVFTDEADTTAALSDNFLGANVGFGYIWDKWHLNLYAHWMDSEIALQGMVMYDVTSKKK